MLTVYTAVIFLQLTFPRKSEVKYLFRETPDCLFLRYNQAEQKLTSENLILLYTLNISGWVAVLQ